MGRNKRRNKRQPWRIHQSGSDASSVNAAIYSHGSMESQQSTESELPPIGASKDQLPFESFHQMGTDNQEEETPTQQSHRMALHLMQNDGSTFANTIKSRRRGKSWDFLSCRKHDCIRGGRPTAKRRHSAMASLSIFAIESLFDGDVTNSPQAGGNHSSEIPFRERLPSQVVGDDTQEEDNVEAADSPQRRFSFYERANSSDEFESLNGGNLLALSNCKRSSESDVSNHEAFNKQSINEHGSDDGPLNFEETSEQLLHVDCLSPLRNQTENVHNVASPVPHPVSEQITPIIHNKTSKRADPQSRDEDRTVGLESAHVCVEQGCSLIENGRSFTSSATSPPHLPSTVSLGERPNEFVTTRRLVQPMQNPETVIKERCFDNDDVPAATVNSASRLSDDAEHELITVEEHATASTMALPSSHDVTANLTRQSANIDGWKLSFSRLNRAAASATSTMLQLAKPVLLEVGSMTTEMTQGVLKHQATIETNEEASNDGTHRTCVEPSESNKDNLLVCNSSSLETAVQTELATGWRRFASATKSTAKSAITCSGPVIVEAGQFIKEISEQGTFSNINGTVECGASLGTAVDRPELLTTTPAAVGHDDLTSDDLDVVKESKATTRTRSSGLKNITGIQPSQTTTTSSLTGDATGGFLDFLPGTFFDFNNSSGQNNPRWLKSAKAASIDQYTEVFGVSDTSSLVSPGSAQAELFDDSSAVDDFDDETSIDATNSPLLQDVSLVDYLFWGTFLLLKEGFGGHLKTITTTAPPTDYVVLSSPRPSTHTKREFDLTETEYSHASFSWDIPNAGKSKQRLPLHAKQRNLYKSTSYSSFPVTLTRSINVSRHRDSSCATFPAVENGTVAVDSKGASPSAKFLSIDYQRHRKKYAQISVGEAWLSPAKKKTLRLGSRQAAPFADRRARLAPIFRSLDNDETSANVPGSYKNIAESTSSRTLSWIDTSRAQNMRLRRVSSMPTLSLARAETFLVQSSLRSSPVLADEFTSFATKTEDECSTFRLSPNGILTLEEALVNFSSVQKISFPFTRSVMEEIASTRWQQLVACWKHAEMFQFIQQSFPPLSSSTRLTKVWKPDCFVRSRLIDKKMLEVDRNFFSLLSSFLLNLSQNHECSLGVTQTVWSSFLKSSTAIASIASASDYRDKFTEVIIDIVTFAENETQNCRSTIGKCDGDSRYSTYSVGIKSSEAIDVKAKRKYKGDISQVKDVLRGRIICHDESSLICALVRLHEWTRRRDQEFKVSIIRVKNMFALSKGAPALPTGYRHILVNLSFDDRVIAELQLNLAAFYKVLGEYGPKLHRELSGLDDDTNFDMKALLDKIQSICSNELPTITGDCVELEVVDQSRIARLSMRDDTNGGKTRTSDADDAKEQMNAASELSQKNKVDAAERGLLTILQYGGSIASANPRDIPSHFCMHMLLMHVSKGDLSDLVDTELNERDKVVACAQQYLTRCLAIALQGSSSGMTGWFEHGSGCSHGMDTEQAITFMYHLATSFAATDSWQQVEHVLQTVVLQLERQLSWNHPMVLVATLDLAGVAARNSKTRLAKRLMASAVQRVSQFLTRMEGLYFNELADTFPDEATGAFNVKVRWNEGTSPLCLLDAFVKTLKHHARLELLVTFGRDDDVTLATHDFIADALAVHANCLSVAESIFGTALQECESTHLWKSAYDSYMIVYNLSSAKTQPGGRMESKTSLAAYGASRCLCQLGQSDKAFCFLSSVLDEALDTVSSYRDDVEQADDLNVAAPSARGKNRNASSSPFVPCHIVSSSNNNADCMSGRNMAIGFCQWQLATLSADLHPERRTQCLRYLQSSALSLRRALQSQDDEATRAKCLELLRIVTDEAKRLIQFPNQVKMS
ncbi:hypothetical protein MPSEU_000302300 [Mayamaea pseudoterrestris]|nr:hypothetical protein MPSEU_000302300 [Mayamaea pseudoterrestris]